MRATALWTPVAIALASVLGCEDLTEVDLTEETIEILVPRDGVMADQRSVEFVWFEVAGAREYELLVAGPSLDTIDRIAARVVTTDLSTSVALPDGRYEWQLVATNSISQVASEPRRLIVLADSTAPAAFDIVELLSPAEAETLTEDTVRLLWRVAADTQFTYRVQLATESFANSSFIVVDTAVRGDFLDVVLQRDGSYRWRVRPELGSNAGAYAERSFTVDRTAPAAPELIGPSTGERVLPPVTLNWQASPGAADYFVDVRADSIDGRTVIREAVGFTSLTVPDTLSERYFWRVAARDAAGNASEAMPWVSYFLDR